MPERKVHVGRESPSLRMVPEQAVIRRLLKNEISSEGQKDHIKMEGEINLTTRLPVRKQINVANVGWFANDDGPECRTHMVCLAIEASVQKDFCRINVDYTLPAGI